MKYLNNQDATNIDLELITEYKYSIEQLIELAGMSCAHAIAKCYELSEIEKRILICCGPGKKNGGRGLVCARHLAILGYQCTIYYPSRNDDALFRNLLAQCNAFGSAINFIETCPSDDWDYSLIVDALFGVSFRPPLHEMFLPIARTIEAASIPIIRCVFLLYKCLPRLKFQMFAHAKKVFAWLAICWLWCGCGTNEKLIVANICCC